MKRTPLKRSAGLTRTPIRKVSKKRRAALPAYREAKAALPERCEAQIQGVCTGEAQDAHHVAPRGRGGPLVPGEGGLLSLCRNCHATIHRRPRWAREAGLLK